MMVKHVYGGSWLLMGMSIVAAPVAEAAFEIKQLGGFETGGREELLTGDGPVLTSPAPQSPHEMYVYQIGYKEDGNPWSSVTTDGGFIHAFHFRFDNVSTIPGGGFTFVEIFTAPSGNCWSLKIKNGGQLWLYDANGSLLDYCSGCVAVNTWYRLEVYWTKSDSGTLVANLNGALLFSESGQDFDSSASEPDVWMEWRGAGEIGAYVVNLYVDNWYVGTGAAGIDDALGQYDILGYQADHDTSTPDVGDNLADSTTWEMVADTPYDAAAGHYAEYSAGNSGYIRCNGTTSAGPYGDARVTGDLHGATWIFRGKKFGKQAIYGIADQTPTYTVTTTWDTFTTGTMILCEGASGTHFPDPDTDYMVVGFEALIASNATLGEAWSFVLHTPPTKQVVLVNAPIVNAARVESMLAWQGVAQTRLGSYPEDSDVRFMWTTTDEDGAGVTRTINGVVRVYRDDSTSERDSVSHSEITDYEDFDGKTGIHLVDIDTSADAFYAVGSTYHVVLTGATIDGVSNVVAVLGQFSIEAGSPDAKLDDIIDLLTHADYGLAHLVRATTPANSLATDPTGRAMADVMAISGDSVAAASLESILDGTGAEIDITTLDMDNVIVQTGSSSPTVLIENTAGGEALKIYASGSGEAALFASGATNALRLFAGASGSALSLYANTGPGLTVETADTSSSAIDVISAKHGLTITTANNGDAVALYPSGSGDGIRVATGSTGNAIDLISDEGAAIDVWAQNDSAMILRADGLAAHHGLHILGSDVGAALKIQAENVTNAIGLQVIGGNGGDAVRLTTTSGGTGLYIAAPGTGSGIGLEVWGGESGTAAQFTTTSGTGKSIVGDLEANGYQSGCTSCVTAAVTTDSESRTASQADLSGVPAAVWAFATRQPNGGSVETVTNAVVTDAASRTASQADLTGVPADVWTYATREITGGTIDDGTVATVTNAVTTDAASRTASQADLSGVPAAVWTYETREITGGTTDDLTNPADVTAGSRAAIVQAMFAETLDGMAFSDWIEAMGAAHFGVTTITDLGVQGEQVSFKGRDGTTEKLRVRGKNRQREESVVVTE